MLDSSLLPIGQLRLPYLFWRAIAILVFILSSAWIAWRLYASPYDDLPTFYWATRLAFDQGLSAYQPVHFLELGQALNRKIYPFLYPPPSLMLFSPVLFCTDYEQCKTIFSMLNLFCWWILAWALYVFYFRCIGTSHKQNVMGILLLFFTLVYMPIMDTLKNGQVNLIVFLCLMPTLFAPASRNQQILAGLLLACAIILKIYVLLLIPVMLMFGRWREVIITLAFLILLIVMSLVLLPESMWREWFELSMGIGYGKGIPQVLTVPFNQSINGFFIRYFLDQRGVGQPTDWILWIYGSVLLCVFLAGYSILKYLRSWQKGYPVALALVLLLINLIAPLTWLHHYVFTLPAIILVVAFLQRVPPARSKMLTVILLVLALGFLAAPYLSAWAFADKVLTSEAGRGMGLAYNLVLSTPLVAAIAIFMLFLRLIAKKDDFSGSH